MPTVRECIDIQDTSVEIKIEFELWCANCGHGICHNTSYKKYSTNHFETFCDSCNESKNNIIKERDDLADDCATLKSENNFLKELVRRLNILSKDTSHETS